MRRTPCSNRGATGFTTGGGGATTGLERFVSGTNAPPVLLALPVPQLPLEQPISLLGPKPQHSCVGSAYSQPSLVPLRGARNSRLHPPRLRNGALCTSGISIPHALR